MKVIVFTEKDFSCVKLWFSRAFPNMDRDVNKLVVGVRADAVDPVVSAADAEVEVEAVVSAANAGTPDDITVQDIDALSKIEAFYHATEDERENNNTSFGEGR